MDEWFLQSLGFMKRSVDNLQSDIGKTSNFVTFYGFLTRLCEHHTGYIRESF
jgi:hypothetical protein